MSNSNPQVERLTTWGFTKEEIERRWQVNRLYDPVNRFLKSSNGSDTGTNSPPQADNSMQMLSFLEQLLPQSGSEVE